MRWQPSEKNCSMAQEKHNDPIKKGTDARFTVACAILAAVWVASAVFSFWVLRIIPSYVPHLQSAYVPWIYAGVATGWCIPALTLWGLKKEKNKIFGIRIKSISLVSFVIQAILLAGSILLVLTQAYCGFFSSAAYLSDTYWLCGKSMGEWLPFVVGLSAMVLRTIKDLLALVFVWNKQDHTISMKET